MRSLLAVVEAADSPPSPPTAPLPTHSLIDGHRHVAFHLTLQDAQAGVVPIGLLRADVLNAMMAEGANTADGCPWKLCEVGLRSAVLAGVVSPIVKPVCCHFQDWVIEKGSEEMGRIMQSMVERWKEEGMFANVLNTWRNEMYQIYASPKSTFFSGQDVSAPFSNKAFILERAACTLFGLVTYGVALTAYEGEGRDMKIWVAKRSMNRAKFPGMIDSTVAGGLPAGMGPLDCMIKECAEEASLSEEFVRPRIKQTGMLSFFHITPDGFLQPEVDFVYDLAFPPRSSIEYVEPKPCDDEVESFRLMSVQDTLSAMHAGEFKPSCGAALVDFMMRHGLVTAETEPKYLEIRWKLSRRLEVAIPDTTKLFQLEREEATGAVFYVSAGL